MIMSIYAFSLQSIDPTIVNAFYDMYDNSVGKKLQILISMYFL